MLILIASGYEQLSEWAARIVAKAIRNKPNLVLGLAAGSTPLGTYRELVRLHKNGEVDFREVVTFNLDEYLGLPATHPQSYHHFMKTALFDHINIRPENVHIPDGSIEGDLEAYCSAYERAIQEAGGLDLQILGIGRHAHIGFNEPGSSLRSRTRIKTLTEQTREDNRRFFAPGERAPEAAITVGVATILEAQRILMLASGEHKANAIAKAIEGPLSASASASALQLHADVTVVVDEDAARELQEKDYYRRVAEMTARLTPERLW
jgi:glucosamine-6-phosphate deaminase